MTRPQLAFEWPVPTSYAREDFIASAANGAALAFSESWNGPGAALLSGGEGAGKTHLARLWLARVGGVRLEAGRMGAVTSEQLLAGATHALLEDLHAPHDETALFHLLRHAETQGVTLLLTSRLRAAALAVTLPDLRSRLCALPGAHIDAPDETLLAAFLAKCFADHQLRVGDDVIAYLTARMDRSFAAARRLVETIERGSLQSRREITVPWVRSLL